jgi:hypothetical protein
VVLAELVGGLVGPRAGLSIEDLVGAIVWARVWIQEPDFLL